MTKPSPLKSDRTEQRFRAGTLLLLLVFLVLYILASRDFGMGWDETRRWRAGDAKLDYYGEVIAFLRGERATYPQVGADRYPGLFDMTLAALHRLIPVDRMHLGHAYSAFWGWLGIVGVAWGGRLLLGWRLAFFAMLSLGLAPVYLGHAGHNPKDIPFAAGYVLGLAGILWLYRSLPLPAWKTWILCGVLMGLAMGTRIAGGILFPYLIGGLALWAALNYTSAERAQWRRILWHWLRGLTLTGVTAILVLLPFWSAIHRNPLQSATRTLGELHDLHAVASTKYVHFMGNFYEAGSTPWFYAPWMLLIKSPEIWLLGLLALGAITILKYPELRKAPRTFLVQSGPYVLLGLSFVFPLLYVLWMQPQIHNGERHILFLFPPMALLAALGLERLFDVLQNTKGSYKWLYLGFLIFAGLMLIERNLRLHPYQSLYFNALVGGPPRALVRRAKRGASCRMKVPTL